MLSTGFCNGDNSDTGGQSCRQTDPRAKHPQNHRVARPHQLNLTSYTNAHRSQPGRILGIDLKLINTGDSRRGKLRKRDGERDRLHGRLGKV